MSVIQLNIPLSPGMHRDISVTQKTEANGLASGFQYTVQVPNDTSAFLTITSSASSDGVNFEVFDTQRCQGGPVNVAKGGVPFITNTVRVPDAFNQIGNTIRSSVTECTGSWVLTAAGTLAF